MQYVEVELDPGESAVAEAGAMMYMTSGIAMETVFGGRQPGPALGRHEQADRRREAAAHR